MKIIFLIFPDIIWLMQAWFYFNHCTEAVQRKCELLWSTRWFFWYLLLSGISPSLKVRQVLNVKVHSAEILVFLLPPPSVRFLFQGFFPTLGCSWTRRSAMVLILLAVPHWVRIFESAAYSIAPAPKLHQHPPGVFFQPLYSSETVVTWKYSLSFSVVLGQHLTGLQRHQEAAFLQDKSTEEHLETPLGSSQHLALCSTLKSGFDSDPSSEHLLSCQKVLHLAHAMSFLSPGLQRHLWRKAVEPLWRWGTPEAKKRPYSEG